MIFYPDLRKITINTPNYKGMFLRGYGSQNHIKNNGTQVGNTSTNHASGSIGVIQGDGARKITGRIGHYENGILRKHSIGSVFPASPTPSRMAIANDKDYPFSNVLNNHPYDWTAYCDIDTTREIPAANEIRPVNIAVRYLIRTR